MSTFPTVVWRQESLGLEPGVPVGVSGSSSTLCPPGHRRQEGGHLQSEVAQLEETTRALVKDVHLVLEGPHRVVGYLIHSQHFPQGEAEQAHSTAGQQGAPAQSPEGQGSSGLWGRRRCHDALEREHKGF